jgi:hypothetical protein
VSAAIIVPARTFLEAMFIDAAPGVHTMTCGFPTDPTTAGRHEWMGRPWCPGDAVPSWFDTANTYLTVRTFEPDDETGERRRRKANFQAMHAVMVDDVGTKVLPEKLSLRASAVIETSPRNFQAYYFLKQDRDSQERDTAERLVNRMVAAGLTADSCDPGMKGVTRYGRLPVGINNKAKYLEQLGHPFAVLCARFNPELRYSISEIAATWRLDMTPERPRAAVIRLSGVQAERAADSFSGLLRTLEWMQMYRGRNASGLWHDILCPWVDEHTGGAHTGTALAEPSGENNYAGGFKCHHGHCELRTIRDVWKWARELDLLLRHQQS